MRIRVTVPSEHVDDWVLGKALDASAAVACREVETGRIPALRDAIRCGAVRWRPEPAKQGFEGFDNPTDVLARGWGDCDDLASWLAGEYWATGEDPEARPVVYESKPGRWHAVVQRSDGSIEDPSRWAGMGKPGGPLPIVSPAKDTDHMVVGVRKRADGLTRARIDTPWVKGHGVAVQCVGDNPYHALGRTADRAAAVLAFWGAPDDVILRLHAISHLLLDHGPNLEDFADLHGCHPHDLGAFVNALAERVGATTYTTTMQPNFGQIADIAATFFDPFGLRKMVAPMAQSMLSAYMQPGGMMPQGQVLVQAPVPANPPKLVLTAPSVQVTPPSVTTSGDWSVDGVDGDGDVRFGAPLSDGAFADLLDNLRSQGWTCSDVTAHHAKCSRSGAVFVMVNDEDMLRVQRLAGDWSAIMFATKIAGDLDIYDDRFVTDEVRSDVPENVMPGPQEVYFGSRQALVGAGALPRVLCVQTPDGHVQCIPVVGTTLYATKGFGRATSRTPQPRKKGTGKGLTPQQQAQRDAAKGASPSETNRDQDQQDQRDQPLSDRERLSPRERAQQQQPYDDGYGGYGPYYAQQPPPDYGYPPPAYYAPGSDAADESEYSGTPTAWGHHRHDWSDYDASQDDEGG